MVNLDRPVNLEKLEVAGALTDPNFSADVLDAQVAIDTLHEDTAFESSNARVATRVLDSQSKPMRKVNSGVAVRSKRQNAVDWLVARITMIRVLTRVGNRWVVPVLHEWNRCRL